MRRENDIIQLLKDNYAKHYGFNSWEDFANEYYYKDSFRVFHALDDISLTALRITEEVYNCPLCDGDGYRTLGHPVDEQRDDCPVCHGTGISQYRKASP